MIADDHKTLAHGLLDDGLHALAAHAQDIHELTLGKGAIGLVQSDNQRANTVLKALRAKLMKRQVGKLARLLELGDGLLHLCHCFLPFI